MADQNDERVRFLGLHAEREQEHPIPGNRGLHLCNAVFQVVRQRPKCTLCTSALIIVTMAAVCSVLVTVPVWKTGYRRNLMSISNFTHGDTYLTDMFNSPSSFKFCSSVTIETNYTKENFTAILELFQTKPTLTDWDTLLATYNETIPFDKYRLLWVFHLNTGSHLKMKVDVHVQGERKCNHSRRDKFIVAIIRGYDNYTKWSKAPDQDYMEYAVDLKSFYIGKHIVEFNYSGDGEYYHVVENSLVIPKCSIQVTANATVTRTLYSYNRLASHCKVYWNKTTCRKTSDKAHYGLVIINEESDIVKWHKINTSIVLSCIPNNRLYAGLGIGAAGIVLVVSTVSLLGLYCCTRVRGNHPPAGNQEGNEEHLLQHIDEEQLDPPPPPQSPSLPGAAPPPNNGSTLDQSHGAPRPARQVDISGSVKGNQAFSDTEAEDSPRARRSSARDSYPRRQSTLTGTPQSVHTAVDTLHERSGDPAEDTACAPSTQLHWTAEHYLLVH